MHSGLGYGLFALNLGDVDINTIQAGFYGSIRFPDYQIKDFKNDRAEVVNKVKGLRPPELTPTRVLEGDRRGKREAPPSRSAAPRSYPAYRFLYVSLCHSTVP